MRVKEVTEVNIEDNDLKEGIIIIIIIIQETKFRKSRIVRIHDSTGKILKQYIAKGDSIFPAPKSNSFFLSDTGMRLPTCKVRSTFCQSFMY